MPALNATPVTHNPSLTFLQRRDSATPTEPAGRIDSRTSVAIGVSLICFCSLLLGFYVVVRWKPRSAQTQGRSNQSALQEESDGWLIKFWKSVRTFLTGHGQADHHNSPNNEPASISGPRRGASVLSSGAVTIVDDFSGGGGYHWKAPEASEETHRKQPESEEDRNAMVEVDITEVDKVRKGRQALQ
ncbi:hypothetical protein BV22DRAFT_1126277 [Leucogyrophana mollusca]|uniref:Uncharacterized protein n=1 Tax=Leucogyrophana mollusca TaxID=85980 RepID=A0ACB8BUB2_9AGAM|nr:hypothetical protein BV22DRAFT_1126277 [Leucogyrophana mollusca]